MQLHKYQQLRVLKLAVVACICTISICNHKIWSRTLHRAGHPVPHAFSTYVGYVLAQGTYLTFCKQMQSLLRKLMFTKCEVSPLCQNIPYISRKGMGDRVSHPV